MNFLDELKIKQRKIEFRLMDLINNEDTEVPCSIVEAMRYSLLAGGKRIRPVLALSIYEALGGCSDEILNMACSLEFIHTYSLIHDDLPAMDNDDLRRGKPTNHKVFGEAMAVLAGDGLLNYAFEIVFNEIISNGFDARYVSAGNIIAKAAGIKGMIGGQVIDIENENKKIDIDTLCRMHHKKTGALIEASCMLGCVLSGKLEYESKVIEFSKNLGIAFQIIDDILDYSGDVKKLGKNTGSDKDNNKCTFVNILGMEESKKLANDYSEISKDAALRIDKSNFLFNLTEYLLHRES